MIIRTIALFLLSALLFETVSLAETSSIINKDTIVKFGDLTRDETWEGSVMLIGDVTIPYGKTLTIKPGTKLIFDDRDLTEGGEHKDQCELIVYGSVEAEASTDNPIKMVSILGENGYKVADLNDKVRVIRFAPYKIDTDSLKTEFRSFKHTYFFLWGVIYIMWVFARNI